MPANDPLLAILGPTGSGKSDLGLYLAHRLNGEIVNFDSVQVFRGFDAGSAKLAVADRENIPHHMIDIVDAREVFTGGAYSKQAREVLDAVRQRHKLPILVGGTGLYLRALLDGLCPAPPREDLYRARLLKSEAKRNGVLHRLLRRQDKQAAARIHTNDRQKLIRALEIIRTTRRPVTDVQSERRDALHGFRTLKFGLAPPRHDLSNVLNRRTQAMFDGGLIEEVETLLEGGIPEAAKPFEALGYKQALKVVAGTMTREEAMTECQAKTRQYAKRQMTWFRRERDVTWLMGFGNQPDVQSNALANAERFLATGG